MTWLEFEPGIVLVEVWKKKKKSVCLVKCGVV
jgi:hypothetical protein